jgi:hypothetical protein
MIVLVPKLTFEADVEIRVAAEAAPEHARFEFRALDRRRLIALLILTRVVERSRLRRAFEYVRLCWRVKRIATVTDMLDEIIVCWDESISEPYSRANLLTLLTEYPGTHIAIYTGYLKGLSEAKRKN